MGVCVRFDLERCLSRREISVPFFVVTAGRVEIVRPSGTTETLVASMDRVSSPARSTCSQAAPRSSERAPANRVK